MQGAREAAANDAAIDAIATGRVGRSGQLRAAEPEADYASLSAQQISAMLKKLESQMYKHAQNLEFEEAARVRDEMRKVKEHALKS